MYRFYETYILLFNRNIYKEMYLIIIKRGIYMAKVLIATVYGHSPIMRTVTKFGVDKLILLADIKEGKIQKEAIAKIKSAIGDVVKIEIHQIEIYDNPKVAKKCIAILDKIVTMTI